MSEPSARLFNMNVFLTLLKSGGILAAGGMLGALLGYVLAGRRDQRARAHEQQMAREALRQDRLERTYTDLGIYLSHYADWARSVHPFIGPVPAPDPLPPEERWRIETVVMNHGSKEVRRLLERWREYARKIDNADAVIRLAEGAHAIEPDLDQEALRERQALEDYRKAMYEAADDIRDRMRAELADQTEIPAALACRPSAPTEPWMLLPPDPPASP